MDRVFCECAQCGLDIYFNDIYFKDADDNRFCNENCAKEYHGTEETDYYTETECDRDDWRRRE